MRKITTMPLTRLSSVKESNVVVYHNLRYFVIERISEDRSSGISYLVGEDGSYHTFCWDYNDPLVEDLGPGKLTTKITLVGEQT